MSPKLTVCCLNHGTKYDPEYVRVLKSMVGRHLTIPHDFLVVTDSPSKYPRLNTVPPPKGLPGWWAKLGFFQEGAYQLEGDILYFDLDVVIRENIDCLATVPGDFTIQRDYTSRMNFNSSVFKLKVGSRVHVWTDFSPRHMRRNGGKFHGDQDWIFHCCKDSASLFPPTWCPSYKRGLKRKGKVFGKVVVFHGRPNPPQCEEEWIRENWR